MCSNEKKSLKCSPIVSVSEMSKANSNWMKFIFRVLYDFSVEFFLKFQKNQKGDYLFGVWNPYEKLKQSKTNSWNLNELLYAYTYGLPSVMNIVQNGECSANISHLLPLWLNSFSWCHYSIPFAEIHCNFNHTKDTLSLFFLVIRFKIKREKTRDTIREKEQKGERQRKQERKKLENNKINTTTSSESGLNTQFQYLQNLFSYDFFFRVLV